MYAKLYQDKSIQYSSEPLDGYKPLIDMRPEGEYVFCTFEDTGENIIKVYVPKYVKPYIPTFEELRNQKIEEMSKQCNKTIVAGIDVEIDGVLSHFSLTDQDQINLFGKKLQLEDNVEKIAYHNDGELCKYYNADQIRIIIQEASKCVEYNITYFNSLKHWIESFSTKDELENIHYGVIVPKEYRSIVLQDYYSAIGIVDEETENKNEIIEDPV